MINRWLKKKSEQQKGSQPASVVGLAKEKRQKLLWVVIAVLGVLVVVLFMALKKPPESMQRDVHPPIDVRAASDDEANWHVESGAQLSDLQAKLADEKMKNQDRETTVATLKKMLATQKAKVGDLTGSVKQLKTALMHQQEAFQRQVEKAINQMSARFAQLQTTPSSSKTNSRFSRLADTTLTPALTVYSPPATAVKKHVAVHRVPNPYHGYLPVGSFFKATLLNGVVAPTGAGGESSPVPILMKVMSNAILPNDKYHYQVAGCFIMGTAFGSVSSERVNVRLSRISCINPTGKALITSSIKGFIVDDDGKTALRGKLINRQGSKLAKAMLAGFAQGLGQMFGNAQGTTVVTPGGTGISMNTDEKLRSAGFNGIGQAANTAAQFYIKQAEQIFPVIVINAGRNVTVDISEGLQLKWHDMASPTLPSASSTNSQSA